MLLPVVDIDIGDTTNEQLQLAFIEDVDQILRDQLVKTIYEGVELLFHPLLDPPFGEKPVFEVSKPLFEARGSEKEIYIYI